MICITQLFESNYPVLRKKIPEVCWREMNIGLQIY